MPQTTSLRAMLLGTAIIIAGCSDNGRVADPGPGNDPADPSYQKTLQVRNDVQIVSATGTSPMLSNSTEHYSATSIRTSRKNSPVGVAR